MVFVIGFIAPYAHIPYNTNDSEGIFGFPFMSSFFFAIGFPIFIVTLAILLRFASSYLPEELKRLFLIFSNLSAFTGFYFLIWSLNPFVEKDFHSLAYYGSMMLIASTLCISLKYVDLYADKMKAIIRKLMDVIVLDGSKHAKDKKEYDNKIIEPTLDYLHEKTK